MAKKQMTRTEIARRRRAIKKARTPQPFGAAEAKEAGFNPTSEAGRAFIRTFRGLRVAGVTRRQAILAAVKAARRRQEAAAKAAKKA